MPEISESSADELPEAPGICRVSWQPSLPSGVHHTPSKLCWPWGN
ncbi:hypothetical protein MP228_010862 [Amoeboaphelidium protococcarum]|nr:hypothetical protein MP228_010862 [Amoeboaphelidium protococcarum]